MVRQMRSFEIEFDHFFSELYWQDTRYEPSDMLQKIAGIRNMDTVYGQSIQRDGFSVEPYEDSEFADISAWIESVSIETKTDYNWLVSGADVRIEAERCWGDFPNIGMTVTMYVTLYPGGTLQDYLEEWASGDNEDGIHDAYNAWNKEQGTQEYDWMTFINECLKPFYTNYLKG